MKLNKNLVIIGMMGSGKSTIGRLLAKELNLRFIDVDNVIEQKTKMKISKIFEKKGEVSFRNLEEKITLKILDKINCVVSLGGGGFLNEKIRKVVQEKNVPIWLNWKPETLINRIRKNSRRPVILNLNDIELKKLIFNRSKIYSKSKYKINCEKMDKKEIVKEIIQVYESL